MTRQLQIAGSNGGSSVVRAILLALLVGAVLVALMPRLAKPLLVEYYRTIYQAEVSRPS